MSLIELLTHHMRKDAHDVYSASGWNPLAEYFKKKYHYGVNCHG